MAQLKRANRASPRMATTSTISRKHQDGLLDSQLRDKPCLTGSQGLASAKLYPVGDE